MRRRTEEDREEWITWRVDFSINSVRKAERRDTERERERKRRGKESLWPVWYLLSSITVNTDQVGSSGLAFARAHAASSSSSFELSCRKHHCSIVLS